jgi:hypothetical protein
VALCAQKCNYLKGRIDRLRQIYHSLKVELREIPKAEAREYEKVRLAVVTVAPCAPTHTHARTHVHTHTNGSQRAKDYEQQIADLQTDLDRAKEFAEQISDMTGGTKSTLGYTQHNPPPKRASPSPSLFLSPTRTHAHTHLILSVLPLVQRWISCRPRRRWTLPKRFRRSPSSPPSVASRWWRRPLTYAGPTCTHTHILVLVSGKH